MSEQISLQPGDHLSAVIDKPFFVSQGMVTSALEGMGFSDIAWSDGPDDYETITGSYVGPAQSYDKPSQIVSYSIQRQAPGTPAGTMTPVVAPTTTAPSAPATPAEAMKAAAEKVLSGPGIGYALLLDMAFVLLFKAWWSNRKKS